MIPGRGRRMMRRRAVVGTTMAVAATASMASNARRNRAERKAIEQQTEAQQAPQENYEEDVAPQSVPTEELEKLAELRDKGILTEEEFQAKKKELLGL